MRDRIKALGIALALLIQLSSCASPNDKIGRTLPSTAPAISETVVREDEEPESASASVPDEKDYILNTNTYKFHYPSCPSVDQMRETNKKPYTGTRDKIIAMGYSPCGRCNP